MRELQKNPATPHLPTPHQAAESCPALDHKADCPPTLVILCDSAACFDGIESRPDTLSPKNLLSELLAMYSRTHEPPVSSNLAFPSCPYRSRSDAFRSHAKYTQRRTQPRRTCCDTATPLRLLQMIKHPRKPTSTTNRHPTSGSRGEYDGRRTPGRDEPLLPLVAEQDLTMRRQTAGR